MPGEQTKPTKTTLFAMQRRERKGECERRFENESVWRNEKMFLTQQYAHGNLMQHLLNNSVSSSGIGGNDNELVPKNDLAITNRSNTSNF